MNLSWNWSSAITPQIELNIFTKFIQNIQMSWKPRNQNNVVPFKVGVENKEKTAAEDRLKKTIASIDLKMQQPYWDVVLFDDKELELLSNFGETIKFPSDNTARRAASVLATYILKKYAEDDYE